MLKSRRSWSVTRNFFGQNQNLSRTVTGAAVCWKKIFTFHRTHCKKNKLFPTPNSVDSVRKWTAEHYHLLKFPYLQVLTCPSDLLVLFRNRRSSATSYLSLTEEAVVAAQSICLEVATGEILKWSKGMVHMESISIFRMVRSDKTLPGIACSPSSLRSCKFTGRAMHTVFKCLVPHEFA